MRLQWLIGLVLVTTTASAAPNLSPKSAYTVTFRHEASGGGFGNLLCPSLVQIVGCELRLPLAIGGSSFPGYEGALTAGELRLTMDRDGRVDQTVAVSRFHAVPDQTQNPDYDAQAALIKRVHVTAQLSGDRLQLKIEAPDTAQGLFDNLYCVALYVAGTPTKRRYQRC